MGVSCWLKTDPHHELTRPHVELGKLATFQDPACLWFAVSADQQFWSDRAFFASLPSSLWVKARVGPIWRCNGSSGLGCGPLLTSRRIRRGNRLRQCEKRKDSNHARTPPWRTAESAPLTSCGFANPSARSVPERAEAGPGRVSVSEHRCRGRPAGFPAADVKAVPEAPGPGAPAEAVPAARVRAGAAA
jgi:hypothetical protein